MNHSSSPDKPVGFRDRQNLDLHMLVGLAPHPSLLQIPSQEHVGPLIRDSGKRVQPAQPLPRPGRIPSLLLQLPPCTSLRRLSTIDKTSRQFKLPALNRMTIVPDEH